MKIRMTLKNRGTRLAEEASINLIGASVAHGHPLTLQRSNPPVTLTFIPMQSLPRFNPARKKETFPFPDIPNPNP